MGRRCLWVVAGLALVAGGCRRQIPAAPPPAPCYVELPRLVRAHPRWPDVLALGTRAEALRSRLGAPAPAVHSARLPASIPPIAAPPMPGERPVPAALEELQLLGEDVVEARRRQFEREAQRHLALARLRETATLRLEMQMSTSAAGEALWQGRDAIIRRYQPEVTRLRLLVARLQDPAEVPEVRRRQELRLAEERQKLAALEQRRDAEVAALEKRVADRLAADEDTRRKKSAEQIRKEEETIRRERKLALGTAQEWEERAEVVRQSLRQPPPGPVTPPAGGRERPASAVPTAGHPGPPAAAGLSAGATAATAVAGPGRGAAALGGASRPAPHAGPASGARGEPAAGDTQRVLEGLLAQRAALERALTAETRQRVLGIARRSNMAPQFRKEDHGLPDRTGFFAEQMR